MTTEAAVDIDAVIPEPAPIPSLELVPDIPATPVAEIAAGVTAALVAGWNAIRVRHPDLPEAVVSMATGGRASSVELAHFAPRRWRLREGDAVHHEVFVTAESLADGADKVFGYLLHEAVHAVCEARGEDDCSASQYHNKVFRRVAQELGLIERQHIEPKWKKKYGFAGYSVLSEETKTAYAEQITALDAAMQATRTPDLYLSSTRGGGGKGKSTGGVDASAGDDTGEESETPAKKEKEDRNYVKATCRCTPAAVIRVSPQTLARRRIMCGECVSDFTVGESEE
ncbi:hypothetical protein OHS33_39485 (plasmid) [Streptomyces sp. NBC_00536]|uniref:hypothetical protein n=1 Tax=Streptomyces sp. NBC_00536 TaxID=2975769 RepID=UPI002E80594F|nr:hypothetical protein [Streptomyces sp. NBC_00536]WUC84539.1 hypothetical protein OHS33_39485 [Streptomyces sp. NBC_00536]